MTTVEITSNGSEVSVSVGDDIVVRLPENATTGYRWEIVELGNRVELVSSEMVLPSSPGEFAPGTGGQRVVRLRAKAPGDAPVRLELRRAWESARIERFSADVKVS